MISRYDTSPRATTYSLTVPVRISKVYTPLRTFGQSGWKEFPIDEKNRKLKRFVVVPVRDPLGSYDRTGINIIIRSYDRNTGGYYDVVSNACIKINSRT